MVRALLTPRRGDDRRSGPAGLSGEATRAIVERAIAELVAADPHQLSAEEYSYLAELIGERSAGKGCRLLVFGVGRDSVLWLWLNRGGRSVFVESSRRWIEHARGQVPSIPLCQVRYGTRRSQWRALLAAPTEELRLGLPAEVTECPWDVIFVDAPQGFDERCPGRMKSIFTAASLAQRRGGVDLVVHDCDREVERAYCDRFLGDELLVGELDRTRHYRTPPARAGGHRPEDRP